jgi:hypothetical protein
MQINPITGKLLIVSIAFLLLNCSSNQLKDQGLKVSVFEINKGWGYKIEQNKKLIIYQPFIPVISGHTAFRSKNDALKTGNLVVKKILNNQAPTLTKEDLIKNGIEF